MYDLFWVAVGRLERCGFCVMALMSDGLAANRCLFRLHGTSSSKLVYKVSNPCSENRDLYFVSDPPHLIKTVRNAWFNKKRHLWVSIPFYTTLYSLLSVSKMCNAVVRRLIFIGLEQQRINSLEVIRRRGSRRECNLCLLVLSQCEPTYQRESDFKDPYQTIDDERFKVPNQCKLKESTFFVLLIGVLFNQQFWWWVFHNCSG